MEADPAPGHPARRHRWKRVLVMTALILAVYAAVAFLMIPAIWARYFHRHPSFDDNPRLTRTRDGHPGDPLNVALSGTKADIERIMQAAGWDPAAPLGLWSDVHIAEATVLARPYDEAPVASLYLFGRKEDLAFELPVGDDPKRRNHVRLWQTDETDDDGRPVWLGSATFDERVGFSHTTGEVTHHIAPDVDAERDRLFTDLEATGLLAEVYFVNDFHQVREGTNGGGDRWYTDGRLEVGVIKPAGPGAVPDAAPPGSVIFLSVLLCRP